MYNVCKIVPAKWNRNHGKTKNSSFLHLALGNQWLRTLINIIKVNHHVEKLPKVSQIQSWLTKLNNQIFYHLSCYGCLKSCMHKSNISSVVFLKARGGRGLGVIFAWLAHMKVPFIAEQPLFKERRYRTVSKNYWPLKVSCQTTSL